MSRFFKDNWIKVVGLTVLMVGFFGAGYYFLSSADDPAPEVLDEVSEPAARVELPPAPDSDSRRTIENILEDGYQRDLPPRPEARQPREPANFPVWLGKLIAWIFIGLGIAAAALFIWLIASSFIGGYAPPPKKRKKNRGQGADAPEDAPLPFAPVAMGDVDAAAKRGDYGEAVHLLLLATLQMLSQKGLLRIKPSMTAREIALSAQLTVSAQAPLKEIVGAVETYLFAGFDLNAETYDNCRNHHKMLLERLKSGPAGTPETGGSV